MARRKKDDTQTRKVEHGRWNRRNNRLKIKKTRRGVEVGGGREGGGGDKQHRRKKMQVRHLVSPEAILKQNWSLSLSIKSKQREEDERREVERAPSLHKIHQPKNSKQRTARPQLCTPTFSQDALIPPGLDPTPPPPTLHPLFPSDFQPERNHNIYYPGASRLLQSHRSSNCLVTVDQFG